MLQEKGANNINLVTPTHYVPQIITALDIARKKGLTLPIVYNTRGYETKETIKMLSGYVDKVRREEKNTLYCIAGDMLEVLLLTPNFWV